MTFPEITLPRVRDSFVVTRTEAGCPNPSAMLEAPMTADQPNPPAKVDLSGADRFLAGLNDEQRAAASTASGPLAILAGAGTGKTRVISHRVAYATASGATDPRQILVVTFTEKAAKEMHQRLVGLGLPTVAARTFHSAALRQLRHFWPSHEGVDRPFPEIIETKLRLLTSILSREQGAVRLVQAADMAQAIEWARLRLITPELLEKAAADTGHELPASPEEVVRIWAAYELAKRRANVLDFEDLLERMYRLMEDDPAVAAEVRARYSWFSVDEYQDTNALQEALLRSWLGKRTDLAVVGDADQTIYSFSGATSDYLKSFGRRYPGARIVQLSQNYRSSPQILALANRLLGAAGIDKHLTPTRSPGPEPTIATFVDGDAELEGLVAELRAVAAAGIQTADTAILVRTNWQIPRIEASLAKAAIPFQVRGDGFFSRADTRKALDALSGLPLATRLIRGSRLSDLVASSWTKPLGFARDAEPKTAAAIDRQSTLTTLLSLADELAERDCGASIDDFIQDIRFRAAAEQEGSAEGVTLSTIHKAKGLEWDAVLLPSLEEGILPYYNASSSPGGVAEERRLLYVAVTRARRRLWMGSARRRRLPFGEREASPSRFLTELQSTASLPKPAPKLAPKAATVVVRPPVVGTGRPAAPQDYNLLLAALKSWRARFAASRELTPTSVVSDQAVRMIAEGRPLTIQQLKRLECLGPVKVQHYGYAIIEVVKSWRSTLGDESVSNSAKPSMGGRQSVAQGWGPSPTQFPTRWTECPKCGMRSTPAVLKCWKCGTTLDHRNASSFEVEPGRRGSTPDRPSKKRPIRRRPR